MIRGNYTAHGPANGGTVSGSTGRRGGERVAGLPVELMDSEIQFERLFMLSTNVLPNGAPISTVPSTGLPSRIALVPNMFRTSRPASMPPTAFPVFITCTTILLRADKLCVVGGNVGNGIRGPCVSVERSG